VKGGEYILNLKNILKTFKVNESTISMVLGAIVVLIVGSLVVNYLRNRQGTVPEELLKQNSAVESSQKVYTVKDGDTLWSIAETYYSDGYKWVDIAEANGLLDASQIEVGQELTIPVLEDTGAVAISDSGVVATKTVTASQDSITAATYEVVHGDNLWDIAVRAYGDGYRWVDIAEENNLANPDIIHAGNILVLPR